MVRSETIGHSTGKVTGVTERVDPYFPYHARYEVRAVI